MNTRITAKATLFSLLINLLLPFFAVYTPVSVADEFYQDMLVVCTSQGVKLIDQASFDDGSYQFKLDQYDSVTDEEVPHSLPHLECGLCFVAQMHLDKIMLWSPQVEPVQPYQTTSYLSHVESNDHSLESQLGFLTRAPPTVSL